MLTLGTNMRYETMKYLNQIIKSSNSTHHWTDFGLVLSALIIQAGDGLNTKFDYGKNNIRRSVIYMVWIFIKVNDLHKSDS